MIAFTVLPVSYTHLDVYKRQVSKTECVTDLFYGTDYNSHLGTKRGGLALSLIHILKAIVSFGTLKSSEI